MSSSVNARSSILQHYVEVSESLSLLFGNFVETAVYDFARPSQALVSLSNGHVTGKNLGEGLTPLDTLRLQGKGVGDRHIDVAGRTADGKRLKSASIAIRDEAGELVGSFWITVDVSLFSQVSRFLEDFLNPPQLSLQQQIEKTQIASAQDEIHDAIEAFFMRKGMQGKAIGKDEKKAVIAHLHRHGLFTKRGAVTTIARELKLTRPSVYSYLKDALAK